MGGLQEDEGKHKLTVLTLCNHDVGGLQEDEGKHKLTVLTLCISYILNRNYLRSSIVSCISLIGLVSITLLVLLSVLCQQSTI